MKKLLREEKIVSVPENVLVKVILFTFLFLSNLSAQTPINGFCRYREFSIKPDFTNVFGVDYTIDGFRDLIIYSSTENKYLSLTADNKSNFGKASERYSPYAISELHAMANENTSRSYFILSRKTRQVGTASFSKSGSIEWKSKIKFDGFPTKIDVGDVDGNGKRVGLVSGGSLDGLHIIRENKNVLKETSLAKGKSFVYSTFIDLDYDKFFDIAAFDAQTNSFILYYNNHYGGFEESRLIGMNGDLSEFKSTDFNSDGFTDLIFVHDNHLEVLLGDSVSSFQKKFVLETHVKPDRYVIQDFNGDGFNDVAFLNKQSGELYISFAKGTNVFYPPLLYMKKPGLVDLVAYVDRGGKKLAVLSTEGKLYLINSVMLNDDNFSISLGLKPGLVTTFDYLNDKFKDICYINESEPSLNLLINERRNLFRTFYSIPVTMAFDGIEIEDTRNRQKTFFLYKKGDRTIEAVEINFDGFRYTKKSFYADGPIVDLKVASDKPLDRPTIYVLIKKNRQLVLQSFVFRDFRYVLLNSDVISDNADNAELILSTFKEVFYWVNFTNEIDLMRVVFDKRIIEKNNFINRKTSIGENPKYDLVCFNEALNQYKPAAAIISSQKSSDLYFIYGNQVSKFPLQYQTAENPLLKYYLDSAEEKIFFSYADKRGKLRSVSLDVRSKSKKENDLMELNKINNYSLESLSAKRVFIIYSDNYQNIITFQKF